MFNTDIGGQISWLIPTALIFLGGLLWLSRRMPRTDGRRAALLLWGTWLIVTGLIFSFMAGIFHPYYTVALAPAIGALVGIGAVSLWQAHHLTRARVVLAARHRCRCDLGLPAAAADLVLAPLAALRGADGRARGRRLTSLAHAAHVPGRRGRGRRRWPSASGWPDRSRTRWRRPSTGKSGSIPSAGPGTGGGGGFGVRRVAAVPGGGLGGLAASGTRQRHCRRLGGARRRRSAAHRRPAVAAAALGGLLDASTPSAALKAALLANASKYTWVAATVGSNNAAGLQLATGRP